jgi:hypothetical protein
MSSIDTGLRLDTPAKLWAVNKEALSFLSPRKREYEQLRQALGQVDLITQGSVQDRTQRQGGGAGYQWTRKVAQKTVTVALSAKEFAQMSEAVENYRWLRQHLAKMEHLSRRIIFRSAPNKLRRKRLSQKALGAH